MHFLLHLFRYQLLHALRLGTGVIVAVAFEQVDGTPDAQARTESDDEGLENFYRAVEKFHELVCRNRVIIENQFSELQEPERYRLKRSDSGVSFQNFNDNCRPDLAIRVGVFCLASFPPCVIGIKQAHLKMNCL